MSLQTHNIIQMQRQTLFFWGGQNHGNRFFRWGKYILVTNREKYY